MTLSNVELAALSVGDLLPLIEAARAPDRGLDKAIWHKLIFDPALEKSDDAYLRLVGSGYPAYTASLDAALALVSRALPGWDWDRTLDVMAVYDPRRPGLSRAEAGKEAWAKTPALAIIAALLKALIAEAASPATGNDLAKEEPENPLRTKRGGA